MSFAVVIVTHGDTARLPAAIEQYGSQTLPPEEIIVVVDGTPHDAPDVLERLGTEWPHLRVIRHERNLGVNAAIMTGLHAATSRYLRVASTHDPVEPQFVERMLRVMTTRPEAGVGFCDPAIVGMDGRKKLFRLRLSPQESYLSPSRFQALQRRASFTIPSGTTIFRRQALLDVGAFNPTFARHADWYANLACAIRYGACYVPEHLAFYLSHPDALGLPTGIWTAEERRIAEAIMLELRKPGNTDLWEGFRACGILPTMGIRPLLWATTATAAAGVVNPTLVRHCTVESVWRVLRPWTPNVLRRVARLLAAMGIG